MRKKGSAKTGGRTKGVTNRITKPLKELLATYSQEGYERFMLEMDKLEGIDFVKAYLQLLEYVTPKLQRVSMPIDPLEQPPKQEIIVKFLDPDSEPPKPKKKTAKEEVKKAESRKPYNVSNSKKEPTKKKDNMNFNAKDLIL